MFPTFVGGNFTIAGSNVGENALDLLGSRHFVALPPLHGRLLQTIIRANQCAARLLAVVGPGNFVQRQVHLVA